MPCRHLLSLSIPSRALSGQQPKLIQMVISCGSLVLVNGGAVFEFFSSMHHSVHALAGLMHEPATAAAMQVGLGGSLGLPWAGGRVGPVTPPSVL